MSYNQLSLVSTFREINKVSYERCIDLQKLTKFHKRDDQGTQCVPIFLCREARQAPFRRCGAYLVWSLGWICRYVSAVNPKSGQSRYVNLIDYELNTSCYEYLKSRSVFVGLRSVKCTPFLIRLPPSGSWIDLKMETKEHKKYSNSWN